VVKQVLMSSDMSMSPEYSPSPSSRKKSSDRVSVTKKRAKRSYVRVHMKIEDPNSRAHLSKVMKQTVVASKPEIQINLTCGK
jgi:hypothetical protein